MLKVVVFDCDGVMFDSKEANRSYYNDLLISFGYETMSEEDLSFVHMHNVTDSVNHIFRHYPGQDMEKVHQLRMQIDYFIYLKHMKMEPDLREFLSYAQSRFRLAISTNRTTTMQPLLKKFSLDDYFELVVTAGDVAHPKPAPDALHKILNHFSCSAVEAIFIGDSHVDQLHTESVGVPLIAFKNKTLNAGYHVNSFMEICHLQPFKEHDEIAR
ncbi:MAG: HAD-IA family hydrolase [Desulfocapsaceae bacterium]|jgi:HAD superfamily hydrolase (TIGR01549 family)|nr:HAD-IA family hydrolase [Desulfocapsaceae bacterium]